MQNDVRELTMSKMGIERAVIDRALEALEALLPHADDGNHDGYDARDVRIWRNTAKSLRSALAVSRQCDSDPETMVDHQHKVSKINDLNAEATWAITAVPEGWRLVPVEPTEAMLDAALSVSPDADVAYERMLAAAPQAPVVRHEPVAWLYTDGLGGRQAFTSEPPPSLKAQCQPLYTHSQSTAAEPSSAVEREPLAWVVPSYGFLFPTREAASRYLANIGSSDSPMPVFAHPQRDPVTKSQPELVVERSEPVGHLHENGDFCMDAPLTSAVWPVSLYAQPQSPVVGSEPGDWRDHVEQRLLTWRQRFMNRSGDQLALDDFMDRESLDDLIDFVCDEFSVPQPPVVEQPQVEQEPDSDGRVMTVVYRNPARDDVQSFMDHPKAVWFGWCHAPYQRDDARAQLMRPKRQPLTDEQIVAIMQDGNNVSYNSWADHIDFAREVERAHGIVGSKT